MLKKEKVKKAKVWLLVDIALPIFKVL